MWYCAPSSSCFPAEMNTSSIRYWMHMHIFSFVAMKQKKSGIFGVSTTRILFIQRHFYLSMELLALLAKDMLNTVFHVIYWEHTALHILYYNKNNPNASGANIFLFYFLAALALKIFRAIGTIEHIWTVMPIVEHRSNNTWGFRNKYTIFTIAVTATIRFVCLSSLQIMNECQHAKTIRYSKCTARGEQTNWGEFAKPKKKEDFQQLALNYRHKQSELNGLPHNDYISVCVHVVCSLFTDALFHQPIHNVEQFVEQTPYHFTCVRNIEFVHRKLSHIFYTDIVLDCVT